ncbi:MAG: energy transducer TonB [Chthoniobacterales bacterium]
MRSLFLGLLFTSALVFDAAAQNARPQFRPSVLGSGSDSLINRIDAKALLAKGQKDGAVMFCAEVAPNGDAVSAWTYRALPDTEALEAELNKALKGVKFTPPIYNYQPAHVLLFATVNFSAVNRPHLQIFLNQDPKELKNANDFISPQPVIGADSGFQGLKPPKDGSPVPLTAVVDLELKVNKDGSMKSVEVLNEDPPLLNYGKAAMENFKNAKFIPAFRAGEAIDSDVALPVSYQPEQ